ncbi:hypothetical protein [Devosia sp. 2618]|uniref:hypothetical protein n=1 Tax=Devosia sp. 2618 TaxID=3156454 RepID=UPI003399DDF8
MSLDVHRLARTYGREDDFVDHATKRFEKGVAGMAFSDAIQMHTQFLDSAAIPLRRRRVNGKRLHLRRQRFELLEQISALGLKLS